MDKTVSNKFDVVEKYNLLYESKPFDEFVKLTAPKFPDIIIATTEKNRLAEINKLTNNEKVNKNGLKFHTHLIWDIKESVKNAKIENFISKFIYFF